MLNHFENDYAEYSLKNSILFITYKSGICIDLKSSVQIVKDRLLLHEGRFLPVLCDIRGVTEISKSARVYLAVEGSVLIKAVAFIVEHPVSEMLTRFYLRTNEPLVPTKSFEHIEEALVFLSKFIELA